MTTGDASDASPIRDTIPVAGKLLIIKERGIWQIRLADDVDPDRANPGIRNSQQKLLARGTDDPLVCRILIQAKRLLKPVYLSKVCDCDAAMQAALAFLREVSSLQSMADDFRTLTARLDAEFDQEQADGGELKVPAVGDVSARGKAFIQAADHSVRTLWQFAQAFDPKLPHGVSWLKLQSSLEAGDERAQHAAKLIGELSGGLKFVRNTRNAVEHRKAGQQVDFRDYELRQDGLVYPPTITIVEKETPLPEHELQAYLDWLVGFLVDAFEAVLISQCSLHLQAVGGLEPQVMEESPDRRRYPEARYRYGMWLGDELVPCAD